MTIWIYLCNGNYNNNNNINNNNKNDDDNDDIFYFFFVSGFSQTLNKEVIVMKYQFLNCLKSTLLIVMLMLYLR